MMREWELNCFKASALGVFVMMAMLLAGPFQSAFVHAETRFIPSAYGTGRYDTNIFNIPRSRLPPGQQIRDFVGTVGGNVGLLHKSRDVDANLRVGGDFNAYATNKGLNFVNVRVRGVVALDRWMERLLAKGGTKLRLTQRFRFTPESPGFLTGDQGEIVDDAFFRGIQTIRANTFSNTTGFTAFYPLYKALGLEGGYSFLTRRFGRIFQLLTAGVQLFDSTVHTVSFGPRYQLTRVDSVAFTYSWNRLNQSGGTIGDRRTLYQTLGTSFRRVMQDWQFDVEAGAVLIEPASKWFPTGLVRLSYQPTRSIIVQLSGSRRAAPSFFILSGAVLSTAGRLETRYLLSRRLSVSGFARYSLSQLSTDTSLTTQFVSIGPTLRYGLLKEVSIDLFYLYTFTDNEFITPSFTLSRHQVGFTLSGQWN